MGFADPCGGTRLPSTNTGTGTYRCSICYRELPLADFPTDRSRKRGHLSRCRDCDNTKSRRYAAAKAAASPRPCKTCDNPIPPGSKRRYCDVCREAVALEKKRAREKRRIRGPREPHRFQRTCIICAKPFDGWFNSKTCGPECLQQRTQELALEQRKSWPQCVVRWRDCEVCTKHFISRRGCRACTICRDLPAWRNGNYHRLVKDTKTCACGAELPSVHRNKCDECLRQTRRARRQRDKLRRKQNITEHEQYTIAYLAERDSNRCGICGRKVNMALKAPHRRRATVDHIIPTNSNDGGQNIRANVQLAHWDCNCVHKREHAVQTDQLLLIG